ncbi:MAG: hypothetical protein U9Q07_07255 [Planctomycetota bacterium]|nr:hypothetical protein [Planctomycetota bacterium]
MEFRFDDEGLKRMISRFADKIIPAFQKTFVRVLTKFQTYHRNKQLRGGAGLKRRTGNLMRSFHVGSKMGIDNVTAWSASTSPYASIHETGGEIKPRRRKFLAIPLPGARTKAGVTKGSMIGVVKGQSQPSLYGVKGLFPIVSKKGNLLLVKKKGAGFVPLFVLKKSVAIPARLKFAETFLEFVRGGWAKREFRKVATAVWKRIRRK